MSKYLIGIDVGGTNTDSVLLDPTRTVNDSAVISWNKQLTTDDVAGGIKRSITELFNSNISVSKDDILSVTIGTTHFINAIVERDQARLEKVAVLRICGPYSENVPPFSDFPLDLKNLLNGYFGFLKGGFHVHGHEVLPIDEDEVRQHAQKIKALGLKSIAVTGIFSPVFPDQEKRVAEILREELPSANIVISNGLSGIGLLERENLTILNAAVKNFAKNIIKAFYQAVRSSGIDAPILLTQNDGTVLTMNEALKIPIKTFSSGTTNSMRGASFLLNRFEGQSVVVIDVGGTTTDVGLLLPNGYPRKTSSYSFIGGVKTRLSMPQVESIGLGGGSVVRDFKTHVTIGPDSVGNDFAKSIVGGGSTLTTSDIAVDIEQQKEDKSSNDPILLIGDKSRVEGKVSPDLKKGYEVEISKMVEKVIDKMKTSPEDIPVLLVGGGSFILPKTIKGASEVWRPKYFQVANAIGAAIGKISATSQKFGKVEDKVKILEELKKDAFEKASNNGALGSTISVVDIISEELPYVNLQKFEVKVIADVDFAKLKFITPEELSSISDSDCHLKFKKKPMRNNDTEFVMGDVETYKPKVVNDEWLLSETDLEFLRIGTYILGCGGGGDPYPQYLIARNLLREGKTMRVVDVDFKQGYESISVGFCGSPTVSNERLQGSEIQTAYSLLNFKGNVESVVSLEIGGGNGFQGLLLGAELNTKVVDADLMGRAYPMIWQITPVVLCDESFYSPCAFSDGNGNDVLVSKTKTNQDAERIVRAALSELGTFVGLVSSIKDVNSLVIRNSISLAWRVGKAVVQARQKSDVGNLSKYIIDSVKPTEAKKLFEGKIVGVEKKVHKGYVFGEVIIENNDQGQTLKIPFQNENIYADINGEIVASVPDLIVVIDADTGEAVGTPDYKYGLVVIVLTIAPSNLWTDTKKGLEVGGPEAFGLSEIVYKPTGKYVKPVSVIEEYK